MLRALRAAGVFVGAIALSGARGAAAQSRPAALSRPPVRWAAAFLTDADHGDSALAARYDGVLRHATLEEMWRPVVSLAAAGGLDEAFGPSFYLYRRGNRTIVGHTGEQSGFRTFFFLDPASTTAVVGVLNTTNEARPDTSAAGWEVLTRGAVELVTP